MESGFHSIVQFRVFTHVSNVVLAVGISLASSIPMFAKNLLNSFAIFAISNKFISFTVIFQESYDAFSSLAFPIISFMTLHVCFAFP